jgi:Icc-related predicted phosphoesterase
MDGVDLAAWPGVGNIHGLHGHCEYVESLALLGLGGSPHGPFKTVFEYSEPEAAEVLEKARSAYHGGKMILVSHCPPKDTKLDEVSGGDHVGSTTVREYVEKNQPTLVISGHVHEAQGIDRIGTSTLVNVGPAQGGNYADIALNERVTVRLLKLP